jgi:polyhydroxyalkanoate synthesis regulator phasin
MATIRPLWESDPIQYILNWKYPQLVRFKFGTLQPHSEIGQQAAEALAREVDATRQALFSKPPGELAVLLTEAKAAERARHEQKIKLEEQARSFNQPHAALRDFDYWASISFWTTDEAVALSLGREPRQVSWKHIQSLITASAFAVQYSSRRELATRATAMGQLWETTVPSVFLAWAQRTNFSFPDELVAAVTGLGIQIADWKKLYEQANEMAQASLASAADKHNQWMAAMADHQRDISRLADGYNEILAKRDELIRLKDSRIEDLSQRVAALENASSSVQPKPLGVRERDSLLKLVIGMAIKGYSFNPASGRSPIAKEISGDLALIGLAMDEDTVRKYMAEAKLLLPGDPTEQFR